MASIMRRLPYFNHSTTLTVHGETVRVKPYQIIVWVSLGLEEEQDWNPRAGRIPVILDTGHTHNLSIQRRHLLEWAGIHPNSLPACGHFSERNQRYTLHTAGVWLHANQPGQRDKFAARQPYRLNLEEGIAVYPDDGSNFPRLPLLGLRALTDNHLHLTVNGWRRMVKLRTRWRWWFFD